MNAVKRIVIAAATALAALGLRAETSLPPTIVLTPYVDNDVKTPRADKMLKDKLTRIVSNYGVNSDNGVNSPFIITAHAVEIDREVTHMAPSNTVVRLSLTIYIGNGEEGLVFANCNQELKGIGHDIDDAYASAFRKLKVNDPEIAKAIEVARGRIEEYYTTKGPSLLKSAQTQMAAGNYEEAYGILLRIPSVCPQYDQACDMLLKGVQKEAEENNWNILSQARSAWNANPTEAGASQASGILASISNATPEIRREVAALQSEMGKRLKSVADAQAAEEAKLEANAHAERMAQINGAVKVAAARASRPVHYHIHWW